MRQLVLPKSDPALPRLGSVVSLSRATVFTQPLAGDRHATALCPDSDLTLRFPQRCLERINEQVNFFNLQAQRWQQTQHTRITRGPGNDLSIEQRLMNCSCFVC